MKLLITSSNFKDIYVDSELVLYAPAYVSLEGLVSFEELNHLGRMHHKIEKWYERYLQELERTDSYPELQDYIKSLQFVTLDHTKASNAGMDVKVFLKSEVYKLLEIMQKDL